MARQKAIDQKIQVTRGFVTEYTPAAFPQEAAIDLDNVIIDSDGSVRRRPGLDLEQQFALKSVNGGSLSLSQVTEQAMSQHLWESVGNSGTLNIVCFQIGTVVQFFAQVGALSANFLGEINLAPNAIQAAEVGKQKMEMASGMGDLYIVSKFMEPVRVTYDGIGFEVEEINIMIRDFEGLDDELGVEDRPATLGRNHYYNLKNQGWSDKNIRSFAGLTGSSSLCAIATSGTTTTGIPGFPSGGGIYGELFGNLEALLIAAGGGGGFPSNSDIMSTGIITNSDGNLEFDAEFIREAFLGNTPAPRGHFILDAFASDYDDALGCPGTGSVFYPTRPQSVAFHQGRAWFSAPVVRNKTSGVYYSQQLVNKDRIGNCYQEADPTADEINDLIDTDGGFLPMPGIGEIISLTEFRSGIVVLASNGVWFITGADGSALTATSISLQHVSSIGALGAGSIVVAGDVIYYWGVDGIIQLTTNQFGQLEATNVAAQTIQKFYINISALARREAVGVFIPEQQKVFWTYRAAAATETINEKSFDSLLVLDSQIKGFYKYSIGQSSTQNYPIIVGLSLVKPLGQNTNEESVTDNAGTVVVDNVGDPVTADITSTLGQLTQLKLAVMVYSTANEGYRTSFATFHSRSFTDWRDVDNVGVGLPMASFIEFAEFNMAALHTKGRPTYVHSFYQHTSKNLQPGGYYELPPLYYKSTGLRISQSVLEVLNRPSSDLKVTQSVLEALYTAPADLYVTQITAEVMSEPVAILVAESGLHAAINTYIKALAFMEITSIPSPISSIVATDTRDNAGELYELLFSAYSEAAGKYIALGGLEDVGSMATPVARSCG